MNRTDIYRQAIKRTFADLYGVSSDTVDVTLDDGETHRRTVRRRNVSFLHSILSDPDDDTPEFICPEEDPVIINLTADERIRLIAQCE